MHRNNMICHVWRDQTVQKQKGVDPSADIYLQCNKQGDQNTK